MELVINERHGGFGLSHKATVELARRKGVQIFAFVHPKNYQSLDEMVPASDEEAESAFITYYYTSPDRGDDSYYSGRDVERDDADLIALIKEWGAEKVSGRFADLRVVEIPDGVEWTIEEYDGLEWVAEKHRTWP